MGPFGRFLSIRQSARSFRSYILRTLCTHTEKQRLDTEPILDKIDLKSLHLYGFHGVLKDEKKQGQRFIVDTSIFLPLKSSGVSDNLSETINYVSVLRDLEKIMHGPSVDLLEHLAEQMCYRILKGYPLIKRIQVSIKKPDAILPIPTDSFSYVGVTLFRKREDFDFELSNDKEVSEVED